jgi:hypothetical protein
MVNVERVSKKGRPLENPKRKIESIRRSQKAKALAFQEEINAYPIYKTHRTGGTIAYIKMKSKEGERSKVGKENTGSQKWIFL